MPKSSSFTWPDASTRMLAGLRSRCTTRWRWAWRHRREHLAEERETRGNGERARRRMSGERQPRARIPSRATAGPTGTARRRRAARCGDARGSPGCRARDGSAPARPALLVHRGQLEGHLALDPAVGLAASHTSPMPAASERADQARTGPTARPGACALDSSGAGASRGTVSSSRARSARSWVASIRAQDRRQLGVRWRRRRASHVAARVGVQVERGGEQRLDLEPRSRESFRSFTDQNGCRPGSRHRAAVSRRRG